MSKLQITLLIIFALVCDLQCQITWLIKTKQGLTYQQNLDGDLPEYPCGWLLVLQKPSSICKKNCEE